MASITATYLLSALGQSGFVLSQRPPTLNNAAFSGHRGVFDPVETLRRTLGRRPADQEDDQKPSSHCGRSCLVLVLEG